MYGTGLHDSLDVSRSATQKIVEEKKKAQDEQQQPKQPSSSTSKVSLNDLDQGVVRTTIASMYSLNKVLPSLDNIRTDLKQSIGYTGSKGRLRKDRSCEVCLHTLWGESKSADGETRCCPHQDQIPSQGQGVKRGGLHSRLYKGNFRLSRNAGKIVLLDLRYPFLKVIKE